MQKKNKSKTSTSERNDIKNDTISESNDMMHDDRIFSEIGLYKLHGNLT